MIEDLTNVNAHIETERLYLRTLKKDDASEGYLGWLKDEEITRYLEIRHSTQTIETIQSFVEKMRQSTEDLLLGIFIKDTDQHIGNIKLGPVSWRYKRAHIGIMIGEKDAWGKGYAPETINALCDYCKDDLGLRKVVAGAYISNQGSVKAFAKAGFDQEGHFKEYWVLDGKPEDEIFMGRIL